MANTIEDTDHILEAALKEAFSPPTSRPQSLKPPPRPNPISDDSTITTQEEEVSVTAVAPIETTTTTTTETSEESQAEATEDTWKSEYEEQVKAWRAQSAEAREKAEKVREQWEAVRAAEREEAERRKAAGIVDEIVEEGVKVEAEVEAEVIPGPPNVPAGIVFENKTVEEVEEEEVAQEEGSLIDIDESPSPADVRDLVSGEPKGHHTAESSVPLSRVQSQPETETSSQKWEEINSETSSSYPSMSFPERTITPPPHDQAQPPTTAAIAEPQTATLAIFDSSLSTTIRLKALASSLSINLLLPFINGVMLGFGEIFAKNVVMKWFGWGSTAANVGLSQRQQRNKSRIFR